jgi:signal peptidase I
MRMVKVGQLYARKISQKVPLIKEEAKKIFILFLPWAIGLSIFFSNNYLLYTPTPSMEPSIKVGDIMICRKGNDNIKRYDVIMFNGSNKPMGQERMSKRVIGTPGDEIEIKEGIVYLNGNKIEEDYVKYGDTKSFSKTKIPMNKYFVMGDNRINSYDSRDFGFIDKKDIKAIHKVIIVPFYRFKVGI